MTEVKSRSAQLGKRVVHEKRFLKADNLSTRLKYSIVYLLQERRKGAHDIASCTACLPWPVDPFQCQGRQRSCTWLVLCSTEIPQSLSFDVRNTECQACLRAIYIASLSLRIEEYTSSQGQGKMLTQWKLTQHC